MDRACRCLSFERCRSPQDRYLSPFLAALADSGTHKLLLLPISYTIQQHGSKRKIINARTQHTKWTYAVDITLTHSFRVNMPVCPRRTITSCLLRFAYEKSWIWSKFWLFWCFEWSDVNNFNTIFSYEQFFADTSKTPDAIFMWLSNWIITSQHRKYTSFKPESAVLIVVSPVEASVTILLAVRAKLQDHMILISPWRLNFWRKNIWSLCFARESTSKCIHWIH